MGHQPFLVIADFLARRGVASLRWDDRGVAGSGGDHLGSTIDDFAADAGSAVAFLHAQPELVGGSIGILGHSEGGLIGPRVAVTDEDVDFLVLLAPPGVPLRDLLQRQTRDLLQFGGSDEGFIEQALARQKEDLALVADASISPEALATKLRARIEEDRAEFSPEQLARLGYDEASTEQAIRVSLSPWFRSLVREDPATSLEQLSVPVLALFGSKDIQVAPHENAQAVRSALATSPSEDYEVRVLPDLNHLFQHAETGAIEEYGSLEETFAPEALEAIGTWLLEHR